MVEDERVLRDTLVATLGRRNADGGGELVDDFFFVISVDVEALSLSLPMMSLISFIRASCSSSASSLGEGRLLESPADA